MFLGLGFLFICNINVGNSIKMIRRGMEKKTVFNQCSISEQAKQSRVGTTVYARKRWLLFSIVCIKITILCIIVCLTMKSFIGCIVIVYVERILVMLVL